MTRWNLTTLWLQEVRWRSGKKTQRDDVIFSFFPGSSPRASHWTRITGFQNSLQRQRLNSKLELCPSLLVIVPNVGAPFRSNRIRTGERRRGAGAEEGGRGGSPPCERRPGGLFWVRLVLRFWPVVPFIVSRENLRLVCFCFCCFFIGEDFGFKMTVSSNKCEGNRPLSAWL